MVRWKTITALGEGRSNNADPLAERGRWLKIKDNCWAPTSPTQPSTDRSPVFGLAGKDLGGLAVSSSVQT